MKYFRIAIIAFCFFLISPVLSSQVKKEQINYYLSCDDCDLNFIRQELPFVSFVRDPLLADVHILVTNSKTASGGRKYYLNFIGKNDFAGANNEYIVITSQSDSEDGVRKALLQTFKIGILQYYARTDFAGRLTIDVAENSKSKAYDLVTDRWNKWIFKIESAGEFQKEESQNEYSLVSEAEVKKVTDEWKTSVAARYEFNRENFHSDGALIKNNQDTREISGRFIKSITDKWSGRVYGEYYTGTYLNIEQRFATSLALEYNIFPWSESNRRVVAISYNSAVSYYDYIAETIYDKIKETLFSGSLEVHMELVQPWGELSMGLEGSLLYKDFSKNRLEFQSDLSVFLSKNLSVYCEFRSDIIHDQLYLPKGDASLEDILLKRRKLATTYEMSGRLGFRFTFGSIYNNVVNERF